VSGPALGRATREDGEGRQEQRAHGQDAQPQLIEHLERDQLVAETFRPVPRAQLRRHTTIALWALRVFAVIVGLMVIYAFIAELH